MNVPWWVWALGALGYVHSLVWLWAAYRARRSLRGLRVVLSAVRLQADREADLRRKQVSALESKLAGLADMETMREDYHRVCAQMKTMQDAGDCTDELRMLMVLAERAAVKLGRADELSGSLLGACALARGVLGENAA